MLCTDISASSIDARRHTLSCAGILQPYNKSHSTTGTSGGIGMEGEVVYIKVKGDKGTYPVQSQRTLFQRQVQYQSILFMADGRPAGRR